MSGCMKGSMPLHAARCKGGLRVGKAHNGRWASLKRQYPEAASVKPQPGASGSAVLVQGSTPKRARGHRGEAVAESLREPSPCRTLSHVSDRRGLA
jgi:hypothetical protein